MYYNAKITEMESKIPSISSLATKSALTAVENEMPDVSNFVEKTDYDTKISEIEEKVTDHDHDADHDHDKYITTLELNKLTTENFAGRLAQANLVTKKDFDNKLMRLKDVLSGLRQLLATESPLKMMKNVFCFTSRALFVLKIFKFLS